MVKSQIFGVWLVLFCFGLISSSSALADNGELNEFLTAVEQKAATVKTLSCNFEQKRHLSIFQKPIIFQGTLTIVRPDKLRWQVEKPIPSVMIFNGRKGLHCSGNTAPRKFDLVTDPVMKIVASQLWSWLSGDYAKLRKNYDISLNGSSGIILVPQEQGMSQVISAIEVFFEQTTLQLVKVVIKEKGDDRTEIVFYDYNLNSDPFEDIFVNCK